jgi:multicomponent Na+:H+ antiporter subunit A
MLGVVFGIAGAALLAPILSRRMDDRAGWLLALAPLGAFVWFAAHLPLVASGLVLDASMAWIPALGVEVAMRLDGLSLLFALLITGIGTLVVLYAGAYLYDHHHLGRFYGFLLLFMTAMLGLVLADDMVTMFVFWELTSVASYLLISFKHEKGVSRRAALQALLITGGGGLALLAGLVLLGMAGETWKFSGLEAGVLEGHPLQVAIMVLILLGAFTKSAQVPFHIWLPNAMNAPTPVSAYLHSATMVKAGVYLLARLNPVLGGNGGWSEVLVAVGATTALVGALLAIRQSDLKRLLAFTTIAVLGQLTMLIGTNTSYGLQAFVLLLLAHSLYKGALFMAVGAVDHATGSRDLSELGGLFKLMPLTGAAVALAAFSNAGLPPFFGFIAKEFKYAGLIQMGVVGWGVTLVMVLTNALLLAAAGLVFFRTFMGRERSYRRTPHEVAVPMWLGPMILALAGFALGAWHHWPETALVNSAAQAVAKGTLDVDLYLWGGLTPAVIASALTILLGVGLYKSCDRICSNIMRWGTRWGLNGDVIWDRLLQGVYRLAAIPARAFQHGSLRMHMALLSLAISTGVLVALVMGGGLWGDGAVGTGSPAGTGLGSGGSHTAGGTGWLRSLWAAGPAWSPPTVPGVIGAVLALAGAGGAAVMRGRLALVAALAASGLGVALFFLAARAPDVAITQFMVETLTVVFLALVFRTMVPVPDSEGEQPAGRAFHLVVSVLFGLAVAGAVLAAVAGPLPGDVASWYMENAYPQGRGGNVVNVILVDFRAFDTLGEIVVVALAGLGAATLLSGGKLTELTEDGEPEFGSVLLRQALRPLAGLLVLISFVLLWRGHYLPGGGFIGGLVAATGIALVVLTFGNRLARRLMWAPPTVFMGLGLAFALGAGVLGLLAGKPFLGALWTAPGGIALGTPLLFDVGVFFTVFGSVMHMLQRLAGRAA